MIPAAKYEKLTTENKITTENNTTTEIIHPKSESASSTFSIQTEKKQEENSKRTEKTEATDISPPAASISEIPQVTEYSQNIKTSTELKDKTVSSVSKQRKPHTNRKRALNFPPPGLPNLSQLSNDSQSVIKKQKRSKQVASKKINTWVSLK